MRQNMALGLFASLALLSSSCGKEKSPTKSSSVLNGSPAEGAVEKGLSPTTVVRPSDASVAVQAKALAAPITVGPRGEASSSALLLWKEDSHAYLLGTVEGHRSTSLVPNGLDIVPKRTVDAVRKSASKSLALRDPSLADVEHSLRATGKTKMDCDIVVAQLKGEGDGSFLVHANHEIAPRRVSVAAVSTEHRARFASLLSPDLATGKEGTTLEVYDVDLDGNGSKERLFFGQSASDDGEIDYSLFATSDATGKLESVGYRKDRADEFDPMMTVSLVAVADLNGDGWLEIAILRDEVYSPYRVLDIYEWDGRLKVLMSYSWVESDCYPDLSKW